MKILVINPGATSTKIAVYEDEKELIKVGIDHDAAEIAKYENVVAQLDFRKEAILAVVEENGYKIADFDAIVGRGGLFKHIASGTYKVNDAVIEDIKHPPYGEHAANLGAYISKELADTVGIPAFFVDPVCVDEFEDIARYSGLNLPGFERQSFFHALNQKAVARKAADAIGKPYEELNLIVVHLGGGVSVAAHKKGRTVDVNNVKDEGAMGMDRGGSLPANALVNLCFQEGMTKKDVKRIIGQEAGVYSYTGTKDFRTVENEAFAGDEKMMGAFKAIAYQLAKDIGAMAAVLKYDVDGIAFTGGMAYSEKFCAEIASYVEKIAPIYRFPGEAEMDALALGALRALKTGHWEEYK
ncbi:MAG: butyrate kinase [Clostridiales bacterium]|nr:butyrate kinase [Candidatus Crickella merdequi]